jgi:uroporphyrinogen decarboxylase
MYRTDKPLLKTLLGETPERMPVWLMRQAGRYLPEYRALRAKAENFLNLCMNPEWAAEITLQPIKRFDIDAAILFADILLVPMALGAGLEFREGEGPVLPGLESDKDISALAYQPAKVKPVSETVARVKAALPKHVALIGFCGAPWTVACYMIDGNSKGGFARALNWVKEKPEWLDHLIKLLIESSELYLSEQIEAGAEALQIFDSWGGLLHGEAYKQWVIEPTRDLVSRMKKRYPHIPIIGFPREATDDDYKNYALQAGVDAMSIDTKVSPEVMKSYQTLGSLKCVQGNLDPQLLVQGGEAMKQAAKKIIGVMGPKHIFNLGHGVVPQTPPEHVGQLVDIVHSFKF